MRIILLLVIVHQIFASTPSSQLTAANFFQCLNPFSLNIMKNVEYNNKNIIYSTLSLGVITGMFLERAEDDKKVKLYELLQCANYSNRETAIPEQLKTLLDEYKNMALRETNRRNATLELVNLLIVKEGITLPTTFVDALSRNYGAAIDNGNFETDGHQIVNKINKFVKERSHNQISKFLEKPLAPSTVMALINSVFFNTGWQELFQTHLIKNAVFYNADKTEKTVKMMRKENTYLMYFHSEKHKAVFVDVPCLGHISMYFVIPDEKHGLPQVIQNFQPLDMVRVLPEMKTTKVNIELPKFDYVYMLDINAVFKKMGVDIENVLRPVNPLLKVSGAFHKVRMGLDELGAEIGAVASPEVSDSVSKSSPVSIIANHPFLFLIHDSTNNVNLFAGVVNQL